MTVVDTTPGDPSSKRGGAVLLANAKSRRGAEWFDAAKNTLAEGGVDLAEAQTFEDSQAMAKAVSASLEQGVKTIIVGGGDGTLGSIAHLLAHKEAVLGVLPFGTGNAFARDLGIPPAIEQACQVIAEGHVSRVDLGLINGHDFLNVATVGLTTLIAQGLERNAKRRFGRAAYIFAIARALSLAQPFRVELNAGSDERRFDSLQVVIGNGRFHAGPFPIAPEASITGGFLSVYALASRQKSAFFRMALHMWGGRHVLLDDVISLRVQAGTLRTFPSKRVVVDGEICAPTPAEFGIAPGALRVFTPPDPPDG